MTKHNMQNFGLSPFSSAIDKDKKGPSSVRQILEPILRQCWVEFWESMLAFLSAYIPS